MFYQMRNAFLGKIRLKVEPIGKVIFRIKVAKKQLKVYMPSPLSPM